MSEHLSQASRPLLLRATSLKILSVLLLIFLGWLIYLDAQVRYKFEGKRWALPAQVFARSLEIYEGLPLNLTNLRNELNLLSYRQVSQVRQPGEYRLTGNTIELYTRSHDAPEGLQPAAHFQFRIAGDLVSSLRSLDGSGQALYSVDPVKIGGIYPRVKEERILLPYDEFPEKLVATLLMIEDRDFKNHFGIAPLSIARAMVANIKAGRVVQGGSTLTQQLVKNFYLSRERSITRKINEAFMSLLLEWHYPKQDILETYMNDIFLGQSGSLAIHGFEAASYYYFGTSSQHLGWSEYALLVAMIKGPSYYNPRRFPERAITRRNLVLDVLLREGVIDESTHQAAVASALNLVKKPKFKTDRYPAFLDLVKRQLSEEYNDEDLSSEGLKVYTTLDPQLQEQLENAATSRMQLLAQSTSDDQLQLAAVVSDTGTGEIVALLGDRNTDFKGFNRALDAQRPVGSLIKPAIYLSALESPEDYSLATRILDQRFSVPLPDGQSWQPNNYDDEEHGQVSFLEALSKSYNLSAARLGLSLGVDRVHDTLLRLGAQAPLNPYPSLFLGAQSMSPLDVTQLYQTIASNGFNMPLRSIREVTDSAGQSLRRYPFEIEQVVKPQPIFLLRHALIETMKSGTGRSAYWSLPESLIVAGKTGTSNENRDSWFAGFSGDYLTTVWVGRDDNQPTHLTGSAGALKVWTEFMGRIPQYPLSNTAPGEVDYYWVDEESGALTEEQCKGATILPFWGKPALPYQACDKGYRSLGGWIKSWF